MHLFCLIQKHTLKNNTTNNHNNTLPEPWPFESIWFAAILLVMSIYYCALLNGVFAILNLDLNCLGVRKIPYLYLDITYPHANFTKCHGIQSFSLWASLILCLFKNILLSPGISQVTWGISCC